jgi:CheY-like chemotaxis protein
MDNAAVVAGRLAHDFGNVLTGILGFAELSMSQLPADSPSRRYMSEVLQSAQHGAGWVRKLQNFSRRNRDKGPPSQLARIVAEEVERCREAWGSAVAVLVALGPPGVDTLPAVSLNSEALRDILRQLLDNAREAIADRGVVAVSARTTDVSEHDCLELIGNARAGRQSPSHVEVTITDTGSGLSPEARRRLFADVFFSTKNRQRGLGLAMVYAHLRACQGGLRFGPDPEQGTAVRLYLPVATEPCAAPVAYARGSPHPGETSVAPVLVVDDDPMVLEMVCRFLTQSGYRVQGTTEPAKAVDLFAAAAEPFSLVVSDVAMPGMNGYEMANRLLTLNPRIQLLFISGHADSNGAEGQARDFQLLRKPFEPRALLQAVSAALRTAPPRTAPLTQQSLKFASSESLSREITLRTD